MSLAPAGLWPDRCSHVEGADLVVLNTCHIREKATEKTYSELGRIKELKAHGPRPAGGRHDDHRRRRLRRPGRGRGDHAPPAGGGLRGRPTSPTTEGLPRADRPHPPRAGPAPGGRFRPADEKFDALPADARVSPASAPSSPCRRAATNSAPSAWCPIPAAARIFAAGGGDPSRRPSAWRPAACARSPCWARTSTPMTATAGSGRALFRRLAKGFPALTRIRYTTSHPPRHGRGADRRLHGEVGGADALPASAGAVGVATGC